MAGPAMSEFGAAIAHRRHQLRMSQAALADRMCAVAQRATFTRTEISRYERGARQPGAQTIGWFAESLDIPADQLRALVAPADPVDKLTGLLNGEQMDEGELSRLVYEWQAAEPPHITETRSGRLVGDRLAGEIEARTAELRRLDDLLPATQVRPIVTREIGLAIEVIRDARYTEATGRRLLAAVADLAQLGGWLAYDQGDHAASTRHYLTGIHAGHTANRPDLVASALSSLAYQEATVGNPSEAVLMAGAALRGAPDAHPLARALYADRLAWAYARLGDDTATTRTLDHADDLYADTTEDPAPGFAYWLTRDELDIMRGRTAVELRHSDVAIEFLTAAIAHYPADHIRETALYGTYLVEALLRHGDYSSARHELDEIELRPNGERTDARIRHVRGLLA